MLCFTGKTLRGKTQWPQGTFLLKQRIKQDTGYIFRRMHSWLNMQQDILYLKDKHTDRNECDPIWKKRKVEGSQMLMHQSHAWPHISDFHGQGSVYCLQVSIHLPLTPPDHNACVLLLVWTQTPFLASLSSVLPCTPSLLQQWLFCISLLFLLALPGTCLSLRLLIPPGPLQWTVGFFQTLSPSGSRAGLINKSSSSLSLLSS